MRERRATEPQDTEVVGYRQEVVYAEEGIGSLTES